MKKLKNSDFCTIKEIISMLNFKPDVNNGEEIDLVEFWADIAGNKIAEFSRIVKYSKSEKYLTVACKNSQIANELYLNKDNLLQLIQESEHKPKEYDISEIRIIIDKLHT